MVGYPQCTLRKIPLDDVTRPRWRFGRILRSLLGTVRLHDKLCCRRCRVIVLVRVSVTMVDGGLVAGILFHLMALRHSGLVLLDLFDAGLDGGNLFRSFCRRGSLPSARPERRYIGESFTRTVAAFKR